MKCNKRTTLLFLGMGVLCVVSAHGMENQSGDSPTFQRKDSGNVVVTVPFEEVKEKEAPRCQSQSELELFGDADVHALKHEPTQPHPVIAMVVKPHVISSGCSPRKMLELSAWACVAYTLYWLYTW